MKEKILLLNRVKRTFTNKDTGEVNQMLLVTYALQVDDEDFRGYAPLECYTKDVAIDIVDKYLGKFVEAEIKTIPQQNGFKYTLVSLNNERVR